MCHTSCDSFSVNYQWTVGNLKNFVNSLIVNERRDYPSSSWSKVSNSSVFYPGFDSKSGKAECMLYLETCYVKYDFVAHTCPHEATQQTSDKCSCVMLKVGLGLKPSMELFAEGSLSLMVLTEDQKPDIPGKFDKVKEVSLNEGKAGWVKFPGEHPSIAVVISRDELESGFSKYTYNDSVTAFCVISVHMVNAPKHITSSIPLEAPKSLSAAVNNYRWQELFTDVIKCHGTEFKVHRVVIASQSPFFKSKIERWETSDKTIDMSDLELEIVQAIVDYMYGEEIYGLSKLAPDLLAVQLISINSLLSRTTVRKPS